MPTSAAPNFASLLDEAPTEVVFPKPLPVGTYLCTIKSNEYGESKREHTKYVRFNLIPIAAMDDVDAEELQTAGGLEGKTLRTDFWITPDAIARLDQFHVNAGLDLSEEASRSARNDMVINSQILAVVSHRIDQNDPSRVYADVARTAMAE